MLYISRLAHGFAALRHNAHKSEVDAMMTALCGPNAPNHRNVRGPVPLVERDEA